MSHEPEPMCCAKCGTVQPEEAAPIRCRFCGAELWMSAADYAASVADDLYEQHRDELRL
jgi:hypothetical protein